MKYFYVGLDLGQAQDYTALSVVEVIATPQENRIYKEFHIRHLQRFPLGTPYPVIVKRVISITNTLGKSNLVVDATGVGRPVVDLFKQEKIYPTEVVIHGGDNTTHDGRVYRVPKRDLIGTLTVAFQSERLKIASTLPDAKTLIDELLNFKIKINLKTAHDSYESWREGQHDDLVLSVALACWAGDKIPIFDIDGWDFY